jgi:hypothetical protein
MTRCASRAGSAVRGMGPLAAQARRRALADIAKAADHCDLAGDHHVGGALDAVDEAPFALSAGIGRALRSYAAGGNRMWSNSAIE